MWLKKPKNGGIVGSANRVVAEMSRKTETGGGGGVDKVVNRGRGKGALLKKCKKGSSKITRGEKQPRTKKPNRIRGELGVDQ